MRYEISTGGPFFYGGYGTSMGMLNGHFRMVDRVDRDDLQKACDIVLKRFPFFRVKAVIEDGKYFLETNDEPFTVYEGRYPVAPGSRKANGQLITVGCDRNTIFVNVFHGLSGGRGFMPFTQCLFYHYIRIHYGKELNSPGVRDVNAAPAADEFSDPFEYMAAQPDALPVRQIPEPFMIPERRVLPGCHQMLYNIVLPENSFISYTRSLEASPAAMSALLTARAIDRVHPEHTEPICISMPVDFHDMIGLPDNCRNGVQPITVVFTEQIRKMPLEQQIVALRGQVLMQSDRETVLDAAYHAKLYAEETDRAETLEEKAAAYRGAIDLPVVSYVGRMNWGDINTYLTEWYDCSDASAAGIMVNIFHVGTSLEFSFRTGTETDAYYRAFLQELDELDIQYYLGKPVPYVPMKREF